MKESENVEKVIMERSSVYGDYKKGTELRANIMNLICNFYIEHRGKAMKKSDEISIFDIVNKLSRIACCPNHLDSWVDISGYAMRNIERLKEDNDAIK